MATAAPVTGSDPAETEQGHEGAEGRGLEPEGTLADNAERIVRVRLDELQSFIPRALDPTEVVALHDMRIAPSACATSSR